MLDVRKTLTYLVTRNVRSEVFYVKVKKSHRQAVHRKEKTGKFIILSL